MKAPGAQPVVFAVSDATGGTAEAAARAALAQFSAGDEGKVRVFPQVLDRGAVETVLAGAHVQGAVVVYTIVGPELRAHMKAIAEEMEVPAVDLLGPLVHALAGHLERDPLSVPGLGHETDAEYFRRIDAVEFTVRNDDGKEPRNLRKADIVFLGISRSGKTPLSNYVAQRGYKVANVPIVLGVPPPPELEEVDPRRVFGLLIDPLALVRIRQARMEALGLEPGNDYGDLKHVRDELEYARRLYTAHPAWTVIDITRKAVEETASLVLQAYQERFEPAAAPTPPALPPGRAAARTGAAPAQRPAAPAAPPPRPPQDRAPQARPPQAPRGAAKRTPRRR